jgi:hypothetical protein
MIAAGILTLEESRLPVAEWSAAGSDGIKFFSLRGAFRYNNFIQFCVEAHFSKNRIEREIGNAQDGGSGANDSIGCH